MADSQLRAPDRESKLTAIETGLSDSDVSPRRILILRLLLLSGSDPSATAPSGTSALERATWLGDGLGLDVFTEWEQRGFGPQCRQDLLSTLSRGS